MCLVCVYVRARALCARVWWFRVDRDLARMKNRSERLIRGTRWHLVDQYIKKEKSIGIQMIWIKFLKWGREWLWKIGSVKFCSNTGIYFLVCVRNFVTQYAQACSGYLRCWVKIKSDKASLYWKLSKRVCVCVCVLTRSFGPLMERQTAKSCSAPIQRK